MTLLQPPSAPGVPSVSVLQTQLEILQAFIAWAGGKDPAFLANQTIPSLLGTPSFEAFSAGWQASHE